MSYMQHDRTAMIIITTIVLIVCAIVYMDKTTYNRIPRKIWTFLDRPSEEATRCQRSWEQWNPGYEIVVLTRKNYKGYVTIPVDILMHPNFHDSATRFSELVRLWVLAEQGGVWLDRVLMGAPLDDWLFPRYAEGAFYEHEGRILPSMMACNKGCVFMKAWRDEFSRMTAYENVGAYVGVDKDIPYSMAVAAERALQTLPTEYSRETIVWCQATDGPYRYLVDAMWNSEKAAQLAMMASYQQPCLIYL